jgi:hypothetical protein
MDKENEKIIIFKKDDFIFSRINNYHYNVEFYMENEKIMLDKILDFNFIKLIYDINPDIYLKNTLTKINDSEANINLLFNHFFEDIGMPQRYSIINTKKFTTDNKITFISKTNESSYSNEIPKDAVLLPVNLNIDCHIITPHKINFFVNFYYDENDIIYPIQVQKIIGIILNKIFIRVKQFIENLQL